MAPSEMMCVPSDPLFSRNLRNGTVLSQGESLVLTFPVHWYMHKLRADQSIWAKRWHQLALASLRKSADGLVIDVGGAYLCFASIL